MLENLNLDEETEAWVMSLLFMLYENGIHEVHIGGLMRVLGVPNSLASQYDERTLVFDEDFAKYMRDMQSLENTSQYLH